MLRRDDAPVKRYSRLILDVLDSTRMELSLDTIERAAAVSFDGSVTEGLHTFNAL